MPWPQTWPRPPAKTETFHLDSLERPRRLGTDQRGLSFLSNNTSCCPTALLRPPPSTFLEEANARPRPVSCGPFFLRQSAQQSQVERRALELRGGFPETLDLSQLPTPRRQERRAL